MDNVVSLFSREEPTDQQEARKVSLEDGYTKIADELIEQLAMTDLAGREFRLLMVVIRKTFGFNKSVDWIALPQMVEMTGIDKSACSKLVTGLQKRKILICKRQGHDRKIGVNVQVDEWQAKPEAKQHKKPTKKTVVGGVVENDNKQGENDNKPSKKDNKHVENVNHKRQITNNTIKDSSSDLAIEPVERPDAVIQSPNGKKWGTEVDLRIAEVICDRVSELTECTKQPNWPDWANVIRLMRTQDKRQPEHIAALFGWANQDDFWKTNILSPDALRRNWGKLAARRNAERNGLNNGQQRRPLTTQEKINDCSWDDGFAFESGDE